MCDVGAIHESPVKFADARTGVLCPRFRRGPAPLQTRCKQIRVFLVCTKGAAYPHRNSARWAAILEAEAVISVREEHSIRRVPRARLKNTRTLKMKSARISTSKNRFLPKLAPGKKRLSLFVPKINSVCFWSAPKAQRTHNGTPHGGRRFWRQKP